MQIDLKGGTKAEVQIPSGLSAGTLAGVGVLCCCV